jgi:DNA-binding transcriptional ArsR family regulator
MRDVLYINDAEQAAAIFRPLRIELLRRMAEPRTLTELARELAETPQKLYYHVKTLERLGLVEKVDERRVGGIMEGLYQAAARSYWLSPQLVGHVGGARQVQDQASLGYLLSLAEGLQADVAELARQSAAGAEIPSLGIAARIELRDGAERSAFMHDLRAAIQSVAERYGATSDGARDAVYQLTLAVYPASQAQAGEEPGPLSG